MAKKKKRSFPFFNLTKKSSITGIILFLAYSLIQLAESVHSSQPAKIPSSSEPIELYSNQTRDDLTALFENAIADANESIALSIYALTDARIVNALQKKSASGIPLRIVCDAKASPGISKKLPGATIVRRSGQGLMHQKILIVDRKRILLGSANLTYSSLHTHGNLIAGFENPALADLLYNRIESMDESESLVSPLQCSTMAASQNIELWILPNDPAAVDRMISLFRSAKKTVKVAMFTWTRVDFAKELIAASERGVKVEVILDRYSGKGASAKIVELLAQNRIPVSLSTGQGLLHHKFVYIDDSLLVTGSANWTDAAFKKNDDFFMTMTLIPIQKEKMNRLWKCIQKESAPASTSLKNKKSGK